MTSTFWTNLNFWAIFKESPMRGHYSCLIWKSLKHLYCWPNFYVRAMGITWWTSWNRHSRSWVLSENPEATLDLGGPRSTHLDSESSDPLDCVGACPRQAFHQSPGPLSPPILWWNPIFVSHSHWLCLVYAQLGFIHLHPEFRGREHAIHSGHFQLPLLYFIFKYILLCWYLGHFKLYWEFRKYFNGKRWEGFSELWLRTTGVCHTSWFI